MGQAENLTLLTLDKRPDFVETDYIQDITQRALSYIRAGYPVHFSGPAGTGKTALAMHVAAQLEPQVILIQGDDEFGSSDLVGGNNGYRSTQVIDNYVPSVIKKEESVSKQWVDNRLTSACKHGFTLIYDEFTRSRPEANNVLLSVLEERLLVLPSLRGGESYLQVHSEFSAIFTSNPEEYAGVHKTQDALLDRMITIKLDRHDAETEIAITQAKSGLPRIQAQAIVEMVREFRTIGVNNALPTIRACVMLARIVASRGSVVDASDPLFRQMCHDVMNIDCVKVTHDSQALGLERLDEIIDRFCTVAVKPIEATVQVPKQKRASPAVHARK
ncbi:MULTISPECIES: gas vesicle protein GvpN [unclassified Marinobacter]|uniref:gas vesicle protein GvpN n=1 Tax=unclassified Marinobacter TaxID=83889 RepID=UPI000BF89BBA|nr:MULTISPECIES: gas vesicle protein GvpN [unclassified Marinobacter]PFG10380.1 gas vesicle protein GvpN [Marinobacter sp. LV10MA510-1]PFG52284.1 gas vesicle protein GvpN [Marinobacter sp. LV10R520-4]